VWPLNRGQTGQLRTAAQVKTISAPGIYTENNEMQPHAIEAVTTQIKVGANFEMVFPHASVVVIQLLRKAISGS
jgi:hypothetical protein